MEVDHSAAADADDVLTFVLVRRSRSRRGVTQPLDGDEDFPRPTGDDDAFNVEGEVLKAEDAFKPAAHRVLAVSLATKRMVARKNMMDVIGQATHRKRVVASAQAIKDRPGDGHTRDTRAKRSALGAHVRAVPALGVGALFVPIPRAADNALLGGTAPSAPKRQRDESTPQRLPFTQGDRTQPDGRNDRFAIEAVVSGHRTRPLPPRRPRRLA